MYVHISMQVHAAIVFLCILTFDKSCYSVYVHKPYSTIVPYCCEFPMLSSSFLLYHEWRYKAQMNF